MEQTMQTSLAQAGALTPMDLQRLLQTLESALPVDEVVHALHVQAMQDASVKTTPAMERFSEAGMHNLHAKVATAGLIRLMLNGDTSESVLMGLKEQLSTMVRTHGEAKSAFTRLMSDAETRKNEAVQSLSQVLGLADQVAAALKPYVTAMTGTPPS